MTHYHVECDVKPQFSQSVWIKAVKE